MNVADPNQKRRRNTANETADEAAEGAGWLAGGATGAAVGSVFGPLGTAAGALAGGALADQAVEGYQSASNQAGQQRRNRQGARNQ